MHPSQQTEAKAKTPTCHKTPDMFDKTENLNCPDSKAMNQKSHFDLEKLEVFSTLNAGHVLGPSRHFDRATPIQELHIRDMAAIATTESRTQKNKC